MLAKRNAPSYYGSNFPKLKLETKLRAFRESIKGYEAATEFSQRANKPLTAEQKKLIADNVFCLQTFLDNSNPKKPTCALVAEALKVSQIE